MAILRVKQGDTFTIEGTRTDSEGSPVPLTGVTIACEMSYGTVTVEFTTEIVSELSGTFRLTLDPATTRSMKSALWSSDVEFTNSDGSVISTDTFYVEVLRDITNAAS